jgi:hypothetical protein
VWASAELLLWWVRSQHVPPLATTGPSGGVLGAPGTSTVLGGGTSNGSPVVGGRFSAGWWFEEEHIIGVQASYLYLGSQTTDQSVIGNGVPLLSRPFFDVAMARPAAMLLSVPGGVAMAVSRNPLQGANVLYRENLYSDGDRRTQSWVRVDFAAGYSYLTVQEGLAVSTDLGPGLATIDQVRTGNEFHGGQIGTQTEWRRGQLLVEADLAVALGATSQSALLGGRTMGEMTAPGGFLIRPPQMGLNHHDTFSVVPRLGLKLAWQVSPWLRATLGYTALLWTDVARPGNQVSLDVSPPATRPAPFAFKGSDLWVQGLTAGVEFCY